MTFRKTEKKTEDADNHKILKVFVKFTIGEVDRLRQKSWSPSSVSCVAARKNCQTLCLGARLRYNLVVNEDIKKPTKQTSGEATPLTPQNYIGWRHIEEARDPCQEVPGFHPRCGRTLPTGWVGVSIM